MRIGRCGKGHGDGFCGPSGSLRAAGDAAELKSLAAWQMENIYE